jgi:hypothetical protein
MRNDNVAFAVQSKRASGSGSTQMDAEAFAAANA